MIEVYDISSCFDNLMTQVLQYPEIYILSSKFNCNSIRWRSNLYYLFVSVMHFVERPINFINYTYFYCSTSDAAPYMLAGRAIVNILLIQIVFIGLFNLDVAWEQLHSLFYEDVNRSNVLSLKKTVEIVWSEKRWHLQYFCR